VAGRSFSRVWARFLTRIQILWQGQSCTGCGYGKLAGTVFILHYVVASLLWRWRSNDRIEFAILQRKDYCYREKSQVKQRLRVCHAHLSINVHGLETVRRHDNQIRRASYNTSFRICCIRAHTSLVALFRKTPVSKSLNSASSDASFSILSIYPSP
jgi:hypothetical protein